MTKYMGIDFAPRDVPIRQRLETFAVGAYAFFFFGLGPLSTLIMFYTFFYTSYYWYVVLYFFWFLYDHKTPEKGGRGLVWAQDFFLWPHLLNYFPIRIIKTAELDPKHNYILGYHPHGIMAFGAFATMVKASGFKRKFPGIIPHMLGIDLWFKMPIIRDILISSGVCSASKESIQYILRKKDPGCSVILPVGGSAEMMEAHPGKVILKLLSRKGFCKRAIIAGAYLVPVFAFGENELFNQASNPEGSVLRWFQVAAKKLLGFYPVVAYGRGIFQYTFGLLPFRKPVYVVVGKPIKVDQWPSPGEREVEELHSKYLKELKTLFDSKKDSYGCGHMTMEFT